MLRALGLGLEILGIVILIWLNVFHFDMAQGETLENYLSWWVAAIFCVLTGIIFEAIEID